MRIVPLDFAGTARRRALVDAGMSRRELDRLTQEGLLVRIGARHLARADALPEAVEALRLGGRLACITAARARGLWVVDDGRMHVTVPTNGKLRGPSPDRPVRAHWTTSELEPGHPEASVESVRDMLRHVAQCQPFPLAVAVFDSAVRTGLIDIDELRRLASRQGGRMRKVAEATNDLADSGLETLMRLGLARRGIPCRQQVVIDGRPVDILVGRHLIVQCDGFGPHSDPAQRRRDNSQDRTLARRGYSVLRFGYAEIVHGLDAALDDVAAAMAQGLHR